MRRLYCGKMAQISLFVYWLLLVSFPKIVSAQTTDPITQSTTTVDLTSTVATTTTPAQTSSTTKDVMSSTTTIPGTTLPETTPQGTTLAETTPPDSMSSSAGTVPPEVSTPPDITSTAEPTTTAQSATEAAKTQSNTGIIAGTVSGAVVLVVVVAIVTVFVCKRSHERKEHVANSALPDSFYMNALPDSVETKQGTVTGISQPVYTETAVNEEQKFAKLSRPLARDEGHHKPVAVPRIPIPDDNGMYSEIDGDAPIQPDGGSQASNPANTYEQLRPRNQHDDNQTYDRAIDGDGKVEYANQVNSVQDVDDRNNYTVLSMNEENTVEYANQSVQDTEGTANYMDLQIPKNDEHVYDTHE